MGVHVRGEPNGTGGGGGGGGGKTATNLVAVLVLEGLLWGGSKFGMTTHRPSYCKGTVHSKVQQLNHTTIDSEGKSTMPSFTSLGLLQIGGIYSNTGTLTQLFVDVSRGELSHHSSQEYVPDCEGENVRMHISECISFHSLTHEHVYTDKRTDTHPYVHLQHVSTHTHRHTLIHTHPPIHSPTHPPTPTHTHTHNESTNSHIASFEPLCCLLTLPFSSSLVSITITVDLCSQTICQKSPIVCTLGPVSRKYQNTISSKWYTQHMFETDC